MNHLIYSAVIITGIIATTVIADAQKGPLKAIAYIKGETVHGNVTMTQKSCTDHLQVEVSIVGLTPGYHGFHVHEKGDLSGGCGTAGGHYNPDNVNHGDIHDQVRHVGDWSNIEAGQDGIASTTFTDTVATLHGERSIIGRAIVVHELVDDLGKTDHPDSKKTGNAGGRIACGVIGILSPSNTNWPCTDSGAITISISVPIVLGIILNNLSSILYG